MITWQQYETILFPRIIQTVISLTFIFRSLMAYPLEETQATVEGRQFSLSMGLIAPDHIRYPGRWCPPLWDAKCPSPHLRTAPVLRFAFSVTSMRIFSQSWRMFLGMINRKGGQSRSPFRNTLQSKQHSSVQRIAYKAASFHCISSAGKCWLGHYYYLFI